MARVRMFADTYRPGNAWFIDDRTSQRHRRASMSTEWDGYKITTGECDPRPPQMMPADEYPEGIPFYDARPPQDNPDRMLDDSTIFYGGVTHGQQMPGTPPGALSPALILQSPVPFGPTVLSDDISIITGVIPPPES